MVALNDLNSVNELDLDHTSLTTFDTKKPVGIYGKLTVTGNAKLKDLNHREFIVLGLLAAAVLWMGVYPLPFTEVMHASVNDLLRHVAATKQ